jgi:hypothetical protein
MSKKKKEQEIVVTYKRKRGRPSGSSAMVAWHIELDDEYVGTSATLNGVSTLLWEMGYSIWAFRRQGDKKNRPRYRATVYKHKEND